MAYRLDKFNGTALLVLEDGSLDTTTDLRFIGKNYAGYGEVQNENFLHLLENFSNNFAPPKPITGQLWFDTSDSSKKLKVYDGAKWKIAGSSTASITAPSGASPGDFWFDTTNQQLYTWNGSEYVLIGPDRLPELTDTGVEKAVVKDIFGNNHFILTYKLDNKIVSIVSKDEFILSSAINPIQGFDRIKKGFTLIDTDGNTGITTSDHYYWGTTSNSIRFAGRPLTDFVLKEEANRFLDEGFTVGDNNDLRIWIENTDSPVIQGQNPVPALSTLTFRIVSDTGNKDVAIINSTSISPGETDTFNLGSLASRWSKIYSSEFIGNLTGNSVGTHKGNILDNSNTVRFNASNGTFNGNVTGNITGDVTGNTTGIHKGNLIDSSDVVRFNASTGTFFGNFEGGTFTGTLNGNSFGSHRGNLLSTDGTVRFNASTAFFNGEFSGDFTGSFTGNLNGLSTNVTGIVDSQNGGTGFSQFDDGQILVGNGTGLAKATITGVSPITVVRTSEGFNIGFSGTTGGTVSSVGVVAGIGISVDGGPITSSGNITVTNDGVTQIVAGTNVSISPANGKGIVTINATASGGSGGVTKIIAGDNISINPGSGIGEVTISSTGGGGGGSGTFSTSEQAGTIKLWAGATAPSGWRFCDGGAISRTTYSALFSRISTTYGSGDGANTFNVPNFNNRFVVGAGGSYARGSTGGSADAVAVSHTHTVSDPGHNHVPGNGTEDNLFNKALRVQNPSLYTNVYNDTIAYPQPDVVHAGPISRATTGITISSSGVSGTGKNIPPYIAINWIIKLEDDLVSGTVSSVTAGSGLTGGTITTSGTFAVDSTVIRTTGSQTMSGEKTFTGGIISQAYNFTSTGNSIFQVASPAKAVQIAVDNNFPHYFYKSRLVVEGSADGLSGEKAPGGTIVGVDQGTSGGAGIAGVHTQSRPGIGVGVLASGQNSGFTGAIFQGVASRSKSSSFVGLRLYASAGADPYFVVKGNGDVSYDGVVSTPAADYAEYFEWQDGNPNDEDRTGMTVSLVENKIKIAEPGDTIIGVVSAVPAIVGDAQDLEWHGKFLKDEFGRSVYETYFYFEWVDNEGRMQTEPSYGNLNRVPENATRVNTDGFGNPLSRPAYNPNYNPSLTYVPRSSRKEWAAIGLLGKLKVLKGQIISNNWIKLRSINENIEEWLVK